MSDIEGAPALSEPVGFLTPAHAPPRAAPECYAMALIGTVPSALG